MHRCLPRLLEKIRCKPQLANPAAFFRRQFFIKEQHSPVYWVGASGKRKKKGAKLFGVIA